MAISFTCMLRAALKKWDLELCSATKLAAGYGGESVIVGDELTLALTAIANDIRKQLVADGVVMTIKLDQRE